MRRNNDYADADIMAALCGRSGARLAPDLKDGDLLRLVHGVHPAFFHTPEGKPGVEQTHVTTPALALEKISNSGYDKTS